eukprot:jgi/Bigna1/83847/fgenesh1_pg.116_\
MTPFMAGHCTTTASSDFCFHSGYIATLCVMVATGIAMTNSISFFSMGLNAKSNMKQQLRQLVRISPPPRMTSRYAARFGRHQRDDNSRRRRVDRMHHHHQTKCGYRRIAALSAVNPLSAGHLRLASHLKKEWRSKNSRSASRRKDIYLILKEEVKEVLISLNGDMNSRWDYALAVIVGVICSPSSSNGKKEEEESGLERGRTTTKNLHQQLNRDDHLSHDATSLFNSELTAVVHLILESIGEYLSNCCASFDIAGRRHDYRRGVDYETFVKEWVEISLRKAADANTGRGGPSSFSSSLTSNVEDFVKQNAVEYYIKQGLRQIAVKMITLCDMKVYGSTTAIDNLIKCNDMKAATVLAKKHVANDWSGSHRRLITQAIKAKKTIFAYRHAKKNSMQNQFPPSLKDDHDRGMVRQYIRMNALDLAVAVAEDSNKKSVRSEVITSINKSIGREAKTKDVLTEVWFAVAPQNRRDYKFPRQFLQAFDYDDNVKKNATVPRYEIAEKEYWDFGKYRKSYEANDGLEYITLPNDVDVIWVETIEDLRNMEAYLMTTSSSSSTSVSPSSSSSSSAIVYSYNNNDNKNNKDGKEEEEEEDGEDKNHHSIWLGIDAESTPTFDGSPQKVSLLQIATLKKVYLIDLLTILGGGGGGEEEEGGGEGLEEEESDKSAAAAVLDELLRRLLQDPKIKKIGHGIRQDLKDCRKSFPHVHAFSDKASQVIELQELWKLKAAAAAAVKKSEKKKKKKKKTEKPPESLSKLGQSLLGKPLQKSKAFSNWSRRPLTPAQIYYAALDAHVALQILQKLNN